MWEKIADEERRADSPCEQWCVDDRWRGAAHRLPNGKQRCVEDRWRGAARGLPTGEERRVGLAGHTFPSLRLGSERVDSPRRGGPWNPAADEQ